MVQTFAEKKSQAHNVRGVLLDEFVPGSLAALRPRIETAFLENVDDGRTTDSGDAELLQFAHDPGVAPAVFARKSQDYFSNSPPSRGGAPPLGLATGFSPALVSPLTHARDVRGETMERSSLRAAPSGFPSLSSSARSAGVTVIFSGESLASHAKLGLQEFDIFSLGFLARGGTRD